MGHFFWVLKKNASRRLLEAMRPPYHFFLAFVSAVWYRFPSRHLVVIGVTGTKGKTTVVELVHSMLQEGGFSVASVSSLRFRVGGQEERNFFKMTMPGRFFLQRFLRNVLKKGCTHVVLEVTSEGIKQYRHRFIKFDYALVTNISPEHLESHGSFEKYVRAKLDLFWRLPKGASAIINSDDGMGERFSAATGCRKVFFGKFGIESGDKKLFFKNVVADKKGVSFEAGPLDIKSSLPGEFNFYNIAAAFVVGWVLRVSGSAMARAVSVLKEIPGHMEVLQKTPFTVVVDYAHTPDSLAKVYQTLRMSRRLNLICVLGAAGGGRDRWKRKEFGKIAFRFCRKIFLTNEDSYDEDPGSILDDIAEGVDDQEKVERTVDRREAIGRALRSAEKGDTVIITGKGAEPWIAGPAGSREWWDDRVVVREELEGLKKSSS